MTEKPDFNKIAERMFPSQNMGHDAISAEMSAESRDYLVSQLRLVWDARGAIDKATLQAFLDTLVNCESYGNGVADAITMLDTVA